MTLRLAIIIILLPHILLSTTALTQNIDDKLSPEQRATVYEVEASIMSPFCAGRLLKDCPSSAAGEVKKEIKEDVLANTPKEEIVNKLLTRYGDQYKAVPDTEGFGNVAWYAPLLFLILGFLLIASFKGKSTTNDED